MNPNSEQVTKDLRIVIDKDTKKMSKHDFFDIFSTFLGKDTIKYEVINNRKVLVYSANNLKIILLASQITYLGNKHPIFKKRVQLKKWYMDVVLYGNSNVNTDVRFIGVYKYMDNIVFVDFDKTKYINKKMNNSSAHIYINDLYQGIILGKFSKYDKNGNLITVIKSDFLNDYLNKKNTELSLKQEVLNYIDEFNKKEFCFNQEIDVVSAIKEMYDHNFKQRKQCEWAGFYVEYKFYYYLLTKQLSNYIRYLNEGNVEKEFDFDLKFTRLNFYGDLKASSLDEISTMLNDSKNIIEEIDKYGCIWYLIYEHETIKDKTLTNHPYNRKRLEFIRSIEPNYQKGKDLSYTQRLKAKVNFKKMIVLEINKANYSSLLEQMTSNFHQPDHESKRNPKFKITKKNIWNAIIYSYIAEEEKK